MALELKFKVKNLNKAVDKAGYVVIDSTRNELETGTTSIALDGSVVIPITNKYVEDGEYLRVTIDDYNGTNFVVSGAASEVLKATLKSVEFSAEVVGKFFVDCIIKTGETTPWDMGDGNTVFELNHTYLYKNNGTYTITNGTFTKDVVITGVTNFGVVLNGNIVTCTPQSGVETTWDLGNGITKTTEGTFMYEYLNNGSYLIQQGQYSDVVDVLYFDDALVVSKSGNSVTIRKLDSNALTDFGDFSITDESTHEYPTHGDFLIVSGESRNYVSIPQSGIPEVSISVSPTSQETPNIVRFDVSGGDTYQMDINGDVFNTSTTELEFEASGYYPYEVKAILNNGNGNRLTGKVKVLTRNTAPTGTMTVSADELTVTFGINVVDPDFEASHTYQWTFNVGEAYEEHSTAARPVISYFPPEIPKDPNGQTKTVRCVVTDEQGESVTITKDIVVYDFALFGNELFYDPEMESPTMAMDWTFGSDIEFSKTTDGDRSVMYVKAISGSNANLRIEQTGLEVGKSYRVFGIMKALAYEKYAGVDRCGISVLMGGSYVVSERVANGDYSEISGTFTATSTTVTIYIYVRRGAETIGGVYTPGSQLWLDSLSIKEES